VVQVEHDEHPDQEVRLYTSEEVWRRRQSRRQFLLRTAQGLAGLAGGSALLPAVAAAQRSSRAAGDTIRLINYVGWIGKNEPANFKKATGNTIKQIIINPDEARIAKLAVDHNAADALLLDPSDAGRLRGLGLLAKLDYSKIPNYKYVDQFARIADFTPQRPYGIPSDYGRDGFVYRTDIVKEKPTSWKEFFALIPKYSGKVNLLDFESDTLSSALIALGHSPNSQDEGQIKAAGKLLEKVKPDVSALVTTDMLKPLLNGSGAMAMDWDYDASTIIAQNPKLPLKWVDAEDGMRAYLDAFSAVSTTKVLPAVLQFMNFHLDPKNYAEFVNTLHISVLVDAARPYVKESIKNDKILFPSKKVQSRIVFSLPRGEAQKFWDDAWASFKSA
jgi:spermidine/putrescine transport system substrate-binding protein